MYCAHSKAFKTSDYKAPIKADIIIELDENRTVLGWINPDLAEQKPNESLFTQPCWRLNMIVKGTMDDINAICEDMRRKIFAEWDRKSPSHHQFTPFPCPDDLKDLPTTFILAPNGNDTFAHQLSAITSQDTKWWIIQH